MMVKTILPRLLTVSCHPAAETVTAGVEPLFQGIGGQVEVLKQSDEPSRALFCFVVAPWLGILRGINLQH